VAPPGTSNHESGRALDIQNYGEVLGAMNANGWEHPYPDDDPWHFDHVASPDIRGMDVQAFQRLWNRNHPEDPIDEDGVYGPSTDARLAQAPAEGFPIGTCAGYGGTLLAVSGGAAAPPGGDVAITVEISNSGGTTWQPGATFRGTTRPNDPFECGATPELVAVPGGDRRATTAPGETGRFTFCAQVSGRGRRSAIDRPWSGRGGGPWFGPDDIALHRVASGTGDGDLAAGCAAGAGHPARPRCSAALACLWLRRRPLLVTRGASAYRRRRTVGPAPPRRSRAPSGAR
jgi:hypothetical protein